MERKMEHELGFDFLRVVEAAAIASAQTMGQGDRKYSDHVAVEAMRKIMDTVPMRGEIVIGEGERDEAPMLYIGEKVGLGHKDSTENPEQYAEVDIAVDPLEGTNLCATGSSNAIAVMACSEKNGLLHAPDLYMQKLIVGPSAKGAVDIDAPVKDNLKAIARRLSRDIDDLVVIVLDRPRHQRAHTADHRRRPVGRYFRRRRRLRHPRRDGDGRRARGRPDRRRHEVPERADPGPLRPQGTA